MREKFDPPINRKLFKNMKSELDHENGPYRRETSGLKKIAVTFALAAGVAAVASYITNDSEQSQDKTKDSPEITISQQNEITPE